MRAKTARHLLAYGLALAALLFLVVSAGAEGLVRAVGPIGMTVGDMDRAVAFVPAQCSLRQAPSVRFGMDRRLRDDGVRDRSTRMSVLTIRRARHLVPRSIVGREHFLKGYSLNDENRARVGTPGVIVRDDFVFQAGQPEAVRVAHRKAMGLPEDATPDARDRLN